MYWNGEPQPCAWIHPAAPSGFTARAACSQCCHCICSALLCNGAIPKVFISPFWVCWTLEQAMKVCGSFGSLGITHLLVLLVCSTFPLLAVGVQDVHEQQSCMFPLNSDFFLSVRKCRKETGKVKATRGDQRKRRLSLPSLHFPHKKENLAITPVQMFLFSSVPYIGSHTPTPSSPSSLPAPWPSHQLPVL